jgi:hypothetical protein
MHLPGDNILSILNLSHPTRIGDPTKSSLTCEYCPDVLYTPISINRAPMLSCSLFSSEKLSKHTLVPDRHRPRALSIPVSMLQLQSLSTFISFISPSHSSYPLACARISSSISTHPCLCPSSSSQRSWDIKMRLNSCTATLPFLTPESKIEGDLKSETLQDGN